VRLQRPETFGDLRHIAGVLDPQTFTACPHAQDRVPPELRNKGRWKNRDPPQPPNRRPDGRKPPGPYRICEGDHWNNTFPHQPTFSGNDGGDGGISPTIRLQSFFKKITTEFTHSTIIKFWHYKRRYCQRTSDRKIGSQRPNDFRTTVLKYIFRTHLHIEFRRSGVPPTITSRRRPSTLQPTTPRS
jgi:hypothetical protein